MPPRRTRRRAVAVPLPYVVGEGRFFAQGPPPHRNTAYRNARRSRRRPTRAERRLELILNNLNKGVLKGRFIREFTVDNKWNLDFFFPEIRLAIEVDGSIHQEPSQRKKDFEKETACRAVDITVLRLTNEEVYGHRGLLIQKLRSGWRLAKTRAKDSPYALREALGQAR